MKVDDTNDFGFTMVSEEETLAEPNATMETLRKDLRNALIEKKILEDKNHSLDERMKKVETLIMPLIENLKKQPEKEMIKWPNRVPRLNKFAEDLRAITRHQ